MAYSIISSSRFKKTDICIRLSFESNYSGNHQMEHCTGASKEIKFNITYRDKLLHENITRTVLQKEDSHSDDKTEKQQTPTAAWKMGCRGHYHNQGNCGVRRPNRY